MRGGDAARKLRATEPPLDTCRHRSPSAAYVCLWRAGLLLFITNQARRMVACARLHLLPLLLMCAVAASSYVSPVVDATEEMSTSHLNRWAKAVAAADDDVASATRALVGTSSGLNASSSSAVPRVTAEPPPWFCTPQSFGASPRSPQPVVIVSAPRSGSTWLIDTLSRMPCVQMAKEIMMLYARRRPGEPVHIDPSALDPHAQLQAIKTYFLGQGMDPATGCEGIPLNDGRVIKHSASYTRLPTAVEKQAASFRCRVALWQGHAAKDAAASQSLSPTPCPGVPHAMGMKWMRNQGFVQTMEASDFAAARFLASIGTRVLHLVRRDVIAQVVSDFAMRATTEAHAVKGTVHRATDAEHAAMLAAQRISPKPKEFVDAIRNQLTMLRETRATLERLGPLLGLDYVEVAYEDVVGEDGERLLCAVKAYVTNGGGASCGSLNASTNVTVKIHKDPPSHYVLNWEEVASAIAADPDPEMQALLSSDIGAHNRRTSAAAIHRIGRDTNMEDCEHARHSLALLCSWSANAHPIRYTDIPSAPILHPSTLFHHHQVLAWTGIDNADEWVDVGIL